MTQSHQCNRIILLKVMQHMFFMILIFNFNIYLNNNIYYILYFTYNLKDHLILVFNLLNLSSKHEILLSLSIFLYIKNKFHNISKILCLFLKILLFFLHIYHYYRINCFIKNIYNLELNFLLFCLYNFDI